MTSTYTPKDRYIGGERPQIGDRVEAGKGGYGTGRVLEFGQRAGSDGLIDVAFVAWSDGQRTDHPIYNLTLVRRG